MLSRYIPGIILPLVLCGMPAASCANGEAKDPVSEDDQIPAVSFVCVGDNLIHEQILRSLEKDAAGRYIFDELYAPVKDKISAADIAFVNQETVCGGEELQLSDWPRFNSPHEVLDGLRETGFNWISTANNHSLDRDEKGICSQLDYISGLEGVVQTGTHATKEDSETPLVLTVNGIRVGIASYTFGTNGILPPPGKEYLVDLIDESALRADMILLTEESDIQIVAMHWGEEYSREPADEQMRLAQTLADWGVDVIIGAHPHVVQTPAFLKGADGNTTLVYYSLGNFISSQAEPDLMLGAMARFEIGYDKVSREAKFRIAEAIPIVTHISSDYRNYGVYMLEDYSETLAEDHALAGIGLSRGFLSARAREVFGKETGWSG